MKKFTPFFHPLPSLQRGLLTFFCRPLELIQGVERQKNRPLFIVKHCALLLFVIISLPACQNNTPPKKQVEPEYLSSFYLRYLEDTRDLRAEVYCKSLDSLQGAAIQLTQPPKFQGKEMRGIKVPGFGHRYQSTDKQDFQADYSFEVKLANGQVVKPAINTEALKYRINLPVSKSKGFSIEWEGKPLIEEERLLVIVSTTKGENTTMTRLGPSTLSGTRILPEQLKDLSTGKAELFIVKKKQIDLPKATPGSLLLEYYTGTQEIDIVP